MPVVDPQGAQKALLFCEDDNRSFVEYIGHVSASEIIKELPRLTEAERRAIREKLSELAAQNEDIQACNHAALEGALILDRMENDDARSKPR